MMTDARILIAQDEPGIADLQKRLTDLGYREFVTVFCGQEAIQRTAELRPDLALIDLGLEGGVSGVEAGEQIGSRFDVPVIYLADDATEDLLRRSRKTRPFGYLLNATPERQLHLNIQTALLLHDRHRNSERKTAQLEESIAGLEDRTHLMNSVFHCISDGLVVVNTKGELLLANPASRRIFGMEPVEASPDEWSETYGIFYPDGKALFPSGELPLTRAMRGESMENVEFLLRNRERPEGVHVSVNSSPLRDVSGTLRGGIVVFRDITRSKEVESELNRTTRGLEDQTQLMQTLFREISDGVVVTDAKGDVVIASKSARDILGAAPSGARAGERMRDDLFFLSDKRTPVPAGELPLERAIRGDRADAMELFVRSTEKPEGFFISSSSRPLHGPCGTIQGAVSVFRDVTRLKQAEIDLKQTISKLKDQTLLMQTVFDSISDGVIVADKGNKLLIANPSAINIIGENNILNREGTGPEQWIARQGLFHLDRETHFSVDELPLSLAVKGEPTDQVNMFVRNEHTPEGIYVSVSGRPVEATTGEVQGGVIVFRDVTEQMLAEEALSRAFAQGRLEIVGTILHNIGNAINSVAVGIGTIREQLARSELISRLSALANALENHQDNLASYLQSDPQGQRVAPFVLALAEDFGKQDAHLDKVIRRVENMVAHIVEIVRTQKTVDGEPHARKDVRLRNTIYYAVGLLQDSLARRNILVNINSRDAPQTIRIQENKFNQMLVNLIKNAIEAIDALEQSSGLEARPRIDIRAYVEEDFLVLDVIDNGIGIAEKHSKVIFTPGYTTKEQGTGLGLHSIANFVIGSGGQIDPLSVGVGKGTTMRVKFRLSSVSPAATSRGVGQSS